MGNQAIELSNLTKTYGKSRGIENVTLTINNGEVFGFLGPNGAGKTTTIRIIMDFIRPSSGSARVFGLNSVADSPKIKTKVGYLAGDVSLYGYMTGRQLVGYLSALNHGFKEKEFDRLSKVFKAELDRPIKNLSKGNKQKIGLIQVLISKPDLIIFDEPTSGLDPFIQQSLYDEIQKIKDDGRTVFMSSHNLEEVQRTCDRAGFIKEGKIITVEALKDMRKLHLKRYHIKFAHDVLPTDFQKVKNVEKVEGLEEDTIAVRLTGSINPLIQKLSDYTVDSITEQKTSLEEVFFHYYKGGK